MSGNDLSLASFLLFQQSIFNRCLGSSVSLAIFAPWHMAVHAIHQTSQTFSGCHPLRQVSPPSTKSRSTSSNNSSSPKGALFVKIVEEIIEDSYIPKVRKASETKYVQSLVVTKNTNSVPQSLSVTIVPRWIPHHVFTAHCVLDFCEAPASVPKAMVGEVNCQISYCQQMSPLF